MLLFVAPSAPSPTAITMKGEPAAGVVPEVGVNVFWLTGGCVIPLLNVNAIEAAFEVVYPSRIRAVTAIEYGPSCHLVVGKIKVYGLRKSVSNLAPLMVNWARETPGLVPVTLMEIVTVTAPLTELPELGVVKQTVTL